MEEKKERLELVTNDCKFVLMFFRTSSASEYSSIRDQMPLQRQHLSNDLRGAMIIGKIISLDDWVPERPPKLTANPTSPRIPSPDLPPPPHDDNSLPPDEPLPPPPPELLRAESELIKTNPASRRNSFAGQSSKVKVNSIPLSPPAIPMRPKIIPTPLMTVNPIQNVCQMPQEQTVHAQRVILPNNSDDQLAQASSRLSTSRGGVSESQLQQQQQQQRLSVRKRAHNSKDCIGGNFAGQKQQQQVPPPPLKPRMRNQNEINSKTPSQQQQQNNVFMPIVNKVR